MSRLVNRDGIIVRKKRDAFARYREHPDPRIRIAAGSLPRRTSGCVAFSPKNRLAGRSVSFEPRRKKSIRANGLSRRKQNSLRKAVIVTTSRFERDMGGSRRTRLCHG